MRAISIGLLVTGAALATFAYAGDHDQAAPDDLTDVVELVRAEHDLPAMGGAIVVGDRIAALGVSGLRQRGKDSRVTTDDIWHLGSCTKAMTATLAARLVEQEKLSFDLSVGEAFPKIKGVDEAYTPVTLELLLGNRAGTPDRLTTTPVWRELQKRNGSHRKQRRTLVEWVLTRPPVNEPGSTNLYSNAGFAIAGAALEDRLDKPWEDLLREEVFDPLEMESAGFGPPGTRKKLDQPRGHMLNGVPVQPGKSADNPPAIGPAGTVHATLGDWAKFVSAHLTGEKSDGSFLKPETFKKLHTALDGQDYALGWVTAKRSWGGGPVFWHNGSNTMWYCVTWIAPEKDFAVLVTCNQGGPDASKAADQLVGELLKRHLRPADETK